MSIEYDERRTKKRRKRTEVRTHRPQHVPTPVKPIPRRASASSPGSVRARSRHARTYTEDVTRLPTLPRSATWQDEADEYANETTVQFPLEIARPVQQKAGWQFPVEIAEPAQKQKAGWQFPLEIAEPVQQKAGWQFPVEIAEPAVRGDKNVSLEYASFPVVLPDELDRGQVYRAEVRDICELATNPPPTALRAHSVLALNDEPSYVDAVVAADTVMDDTLVVVPSLPITDAALYLTQVEDVVDVALTVRARALLLHKGSIEDRPAFIHNPFDYVRWWLLYPGRLEFLFWLGGAVLLGVMMCAVLVMMGLGLGFMSFGHR